MVKTFYKVMPVKSEKAFLEASKNVTNFSSSTGKQYKVLKVENDIISFIRLDADSSKVWEMNLNQLYKAYKELEDFSTINFKPYVPITHSPGRGLLIHLKLIV